MQTLEAQKKYLYLIEIIYDSIKKRFIWRPSGKELNYLVRGKTVHNHAGIQK
jgi:hypothetical protein